jgi:hypothetical protein
MGFTFCKLEAEAIRQHTGAAGSFFTLKRYNKKPLPITAGEVWQQIVFYNAEASTVHRKAPAMPNTARTGWMMLRSGH